MSDPTNPPAKHLPHGNYERADWFEARVRELEAALVEERMSHSCTLAEEHESRMAFQDRICALITVARWLKEHGSKNGMPDEVFAILETIEVKS